MPVERWNSHHNFNPLLHYIVEKYNFIMMNWKILPSDNPTLITFSSVAALSSAILLCSTKERGKAGWRRTVGSVQTHGQSLLPLTCTRANNSYCTNRICFQRGDRGLDCFPLPSIKCSCFTSSRIILFEFMLTFVILLTSISMLCLLTFTSC